MGAVASLSLLAAAVPLHRRLELGNSKPKPGKNGLTLYAYKTTLGQAVGSIAGIVAYTDTAEHAGSLRLHEFVLHNDLASMGDVRGGDPRRRRRPAIAHRNRQAA